MFHGSMPALVTPMTGDAVDEQAFQSFVEWQIEEGSNGLVPVGTTGESPTLNHHEHKRVVELCVETANGRVPVIAGAGSNSTAEAIEFTRHAKQAGADGALVVVPYYNKPTQEGQYQHFKAVAESADIPVIIYNVPPRSAADLSVETMGRLFRDVSNIVGVKDATANLARVSRQRHEIGADFIQLSGEDVTALGFNAHGGQGCISVTANVAPRLCAAFQSACASGDYAAAIEIQDRLLPLHDALFVESSPGPVKYAVSKLGKCSEFARLPLVPIDDASRKAVDDAMRHAGLSND